MVRIKSKEKISPEDLCFAATLVNMYRHRRERGEENAPIDNSSVYIGLKNEPGAAIEAPWSVFYQTAKRLMTAYLQDTDRKVEYPLFRVSLIAVPTMEYSAVYFPEEPEVSYKYIFNDDGSIILKILATPGGWEDEDPD